MRSDRLEARLGPDLAALVREVSVPLVRAVRITGLPSRVLARATFRLDFLDGRRLKGRRLDGQADAERIATLAGLLGLPALPRVLARRGAALLEEWVPGASLDRRRPDRETLRRAGVLLGAIHRAGRRGLGSHPAPPGIAPSPAERLAAIDQGLGALARAGVLSAAAAGRLADAAHRHAPSRPATGIIHRDFCAENLVVDRAGRPHAVDSGTLALDALDFDLARTWYRWPMTSAARAAFEVGYATHRSLRSYRTHFPFWGIAVLVDAAVFRHQARTPGRRAPLRRLAELLGAPAATPGR